MYPQRSSRQILYSMLCKLIVSVTMTVQNHEVISDKFNIVGISVIENYDHTFYICVIYSFIGHITPT